jgi:superkiller protein 3
MDHHLFFYNRERSISMVSKKPLSQFAIALIIGLLVGLFIPVNPALSADTEKAKEHFNTALQLQKDGYDSLAVDEYEFALKEDPEFVDAYINLGSIYFEWNKYSEAEANFKKATEVAADNPDAWANLGRTYYKEKKYMESEECYKTAVSLKKDYHEVYKDLGLLFFVQKNWPALVEYMQQFTRNVANDYLAFYLLGKGYQKLKKYPEAIEALNKSIELKGDYFNSYSTLGQIYQSQEKHRQAYQMFQQAVKVKPDNYRAHYNLAISYETVYQDDKDKIDQVIAYWEKFLKVAKTNPKAKELIPSTQSHIEDLRELKAHYEEEKASNP